MKIAVINDLHIPYLDIKVTENAIRTIKDEKCEKLIIAGDLMDCEAISKFSKPLKIRDFSKEVEQTKLWIKTFTKLNLPIEFIIGNHCQRLERFINDKVPEFSGLPELDIKNLIELPKSWHVIPYNKHIIINGVIVKHGTKYGQNVVQQNLNFGTSTIVGHSHRLTQAHRRLYDGKIISATENGCLCQLDLDYMDHNNWTHGMCIIENNGFVRLIRL